MSFQIILNRTNFVASPLPCSVKATPEIPSLCPASVMTGVRVRAVEEELVFLALLESLALFSGSASASSSIESLLLLPLLCNLAPQILRVVSNEPEATYLKFKGFSLIFYFDKNIPLGH